MTNRPQTLLVAIKRASEVNEDSVLLSKWTKVLKDEVSSCNFVFDGDDDSLCKDSTITNRSMIMRMDTKVFILKGGHTIPSSRILDAGFVGGHNRDAGKILFVY